MYYILSIYFQLRLSFSILFYVCKQSATKPIWILLHFLDKAVVSIMPNSLPDKIIRELLKLRETCSEINESLNVNNWRGSKSIWGKLSVLIFQRNREMQRGKIWKIWHKNRFSIQKRYKTICLDKLNQKKKISVSPSDSKLNNDLMNNSMFADKSLNCEIRNSEGFYRISEQGSEQTNNKLLDPQLSSLSSLESMDDDPDDTISTTLSPSTLINPNNTCGHHIEEHTSSGRMQAELQFMRQQRVDIQPRLELKEFSLSNNEWRNIKPQNKNKKLYLEWINVLNQKLANLYPLCVIKINYHQINREFETYQCLFLIAEGNCKFQDCMSFRFWIDKEPNDEIDVKVNLLAKGSISSQHYDQKTSFSRHLSGELREQARQKISSSSPVNYHYEQFTNLQSVSVAKCVNFNHLQTQAVVRKIKAEGLAKDRFSSDMWLDIVSTKHTYDVSIKGNKINGYIQSISRQPVVVHMYSEDQMLLLKHFNWDNIILHLDATGSVVRKLDKEQKTFLYYAITIKHPEAKISPIPLAELLISDHMWRYLIS